ncbi:ATP synthase F1 subunit delta [Leadbetterella sp. DM7]|uniref:ATP synthase F1 subunit delta n=1 Tax=Leadbetterella sp. DM7 TaxID=3235085 RepID=UPI00349EC959
MNLSLIGNRYAKALIDLANEQGKLEEVYNDMKFFELVCSENDEFRKIMANPIVRHEKKFGILKKIFENRVTNVTFSIFSVLTKKNREQLLYPIAQEFHKLYDEQKGIQKVQVSTPVALTEDQKAQFSRIVSESMNKTVELTEKIDESLIGGYVLKVGDTQIDTSVKHQLNELKAAMA